MHPARLFCCSEGSCGWSIWETNQTDVISIHNVLAES